MNYVLVSRPTPPPAPPRPWSLVDLTLTGTDGTAWRLTNKGSNVRLKPGARGLTEPVVTRFLSTSAGVHGSRYRGARVEEREVFLPLQVTETTDTQSWLGYDSSFWASLNHRGTCTLRLTQPSGVWRELTCRPVGDGGKAWSPLAPGQFESTIYGVYLVAEDPFWYGPEIRSPLWAPAAPVDYIDSEDLAPPFHPSSIQTFGSAQMSNPGDEPASPVWTIAATPGGAGITSVSVAVDGVETGYGAIPAGSSLVIDTDPRVLTALLDDVDVTGDLDTWDFPQIPPGAEVPIAIEMVGEGSVRASFRPRFDRAW